MSTRSFASRSVFSLLLLLLANAATAQVLRIYNIDVEQADSALVVMPNGKTLLIDSGKNGHGKRVKAIMDMAGVTRIDVFVASHYHEDHYGGIDDLVDMGVQVLETYDRGDKQYLSAKTRGQSTFKGYQRTVGEDARPLRRGETIALDPTVTIKCIGAGGVVIGETQPAAADEENDMSISLLISFAGFRAFFGGDTEESTEEKLAAHDLAKDVDFYKSSHHGSHSSSSTRFMNAMKPSVVVVSNGSTASYHHPRQVTLGTYAALPAPPLVLQTNKCLLPGPCGNVVDQYIADPQTRDADGTITTTVNAVTSSYTVEWSDQSRTIPIKAPISVASSPQSAPTVVIAAMLPNPVGSDDKFETVTLSNNSSAVVSVAGWLLRDRSGLAWILSGSIGAAQSRTFRRNGQPMSLNNAGDEISLIDLGLVIRDSFIYLTSKEGGVIRRF